MNYKQCKLRKKGSLDITTVSFLSIEDIKKATGMVFTLKDHDDDELWLIEEVFENSEVAEETLQFMRSGWKAVATTIK